MIDPLLLTALVASRVSHDLSASITLVTTAMDFIDEPEDSPMRQEADNLLRSAATTGPAKVEFLRYAFGSQGTSNTIADLHQAKKITEDYCAAHKHTVAWDISASAVSFAHVRLAMQMMLLGLDALPKGGVIHIAIADDGPGLAFTVRAKGQRCRLTDPLLRGLKVEPPDDGWQAQNIQPVFAQMVAQSLGTSIAATQATEEEAVFQASGARGAD
ncbi:MAG: histidine phosphotransferase family protein [Pseudomonadota bacterium]